MKSATPQHSEAINANATASAHRHRNAVTRLRADAIVHTRRRPAAALLERHQHRAHHGRRLQPGQKCGRHLAGDALLEPLAAAVEQAAAHHQLERLVIHRQSWCDHPRRLPKLRARPLHDRHRDLVAIARRGATPPVLRSIRLAAAAELLQQLRDGAGAHQRAQSLGQGRGRPAADVRPRHRADGRRGHVGGAAGVAQRPAQPERAVRLADAVAAGDHGAGAGDHHHARVPAPARSAI